MGRSFEKVYWTSGSHDGPGDGVADFNGVPHYFAAEWDEGKDNYAEVVRLTPISTQILRLVVERQEIEERWWAAYYGGTAPVETRPALPPERERYDKIQTILPNELTTRAKPVVRARGEFRRESDQVQSGKLFFTWEVKWEPIDEPASGV
jgi:hypothetical protein